MRRCFFAFGVLFALFAAPARAVVNIDAGMAPKPPEPLAFAVGGKSLDGHVLGANSRYLAGQENPGWALARPPENAGSGRGPSARSPIG